MSTRVLIADNHRIMREGLRLTLDNGDGLKVIGEASLSSGQKPLEDAQSQRLTAPQPQEMALIASFDLAEVMPGQWCLLLCPVEYLNNAIRLI